MSDTAMRPEEEAYKKRAAEKVERFAACRRGMS
jgi:hypothetical protein